MIDEAALNKVLTLIENSTHDPLPKGEEPEN